MGFLTSRTIAPTVTTNDLVHIVITGDTSQGNPSGSSYKATIGQIGLAIGTGNTITISGGTDISVTGSHPNFGISFTGTTGGDYLPLSGGTVSGETIFTSGVTTNSLTATTITNTYLDNFYVRDSGGTVSIDNTTRKLLKSDGFTTSFDWENGILTGQTNIESSTLSATTYLNLPNTVTGYYLPLSGGTVSGTTEFTSGITANTISTTTIGTSGNCVDDIYVYNIHSCSPLNINPLNEGNVYFGQTSGITIDVTNNRLGINNPTPTYPLDILGNGNSGSFYYTPSSAGGLTFLSGTTTTPTNSIVRYGVSTPSYLSKPTASMTFGIRGWGDSTYNTYGNNGDGFIRASVEVNGLTFIKAQGSGTSDYIRFFAGSNPTLTPNLMINGTGATQGFVGINTSTPSERLHVSGNTLIDGSLTATTANTSTLVINTTPTTDPTNNNVLVRDVSTGVVKQRDITSTLNKNYASFYDTGDQTGLANTVLTMSANTSDSWNTGITLSANTRFVIQNPGVYSLAFSSQMVKTGGNTATHAHIWLYQNGLDVPNSASQIGFPSNSVYIVSAWNFFFSTTTPNEYVELKWEINSNVDNQLSLKHQPATGNVPAIPSLIVTINQVN
jgi:hypothetical protein